MHNIHTLRGRVLRTSYFIIVNYADSEGESGIGGNFRLSHAAPRHIRTAHVISHPQKLHSQLVGLVTAVMYQVASLICSLVYGMGLQTAEVIHSNLAGHAHLLFLHVRHANQPTIMGVYLDHKKVGRPWLTETRVNQYQPCASFYYA